MNPFALSFRRALMAAKFSANDEFDVSLLAPGFKSCSVFVYPDLLETDGFGASVCVLRREVGNISKGIYVNRAGMRLWPT